MPSDNSVDGGDVVAEVMKLKEDTEAMRLREELNKELAKSISKIGAFELMMAFRAEILTTLLNTAQTFREIHMLLAISNWMEDYRNKLKAE